jgi:hypothetical protein
MRKIYLLLFVCLMAAVLIAGCGQNSSKGVTELAHFPIDDMQKVITRSNVQMDKQITSDGKGSLKVTSTGFNVVRLFETGDLDVENTRLIYTARLRTEDFEGQVFLGMECHFEGRGDFFSRDVMSPLTGTTEWTTEEVEFYLRKGENPDNVKLSLIMNGKGTAWIDDVRLSKAPHQ